MATIVVTPTAVEDLKRLIRVLSLPADTTERVKAALEALATFPELGAPLTRPMARLPLRARPVAVDAAGLRVRRGDGPCCDRDDPGRSFGRIRDLRVSCQVPAPTGSFASLGWMSMIVVSTMFLYRLWVQ